MVVVRFVASWILGLFIFALTIAIKQVRTEVFYVINAIEESVVFQMIIQLLNRL